MSAPAKVCTAVAEWTARTARTARRVLGRMTAAEPPDGAAPLADWCTAVARRLRAGHTLGAALAATPAAPQVEPLLAPVRRSLHNGLGVAAAVEAWPTHDPSLRTVAAVLRVAAVGGAQAAVLDRTAAHLRLSADLRAERRAHAASARTSAVVLTSLAPVGLGLQGVVDPAALRGLLGPVGLTCVLLGAGLDLLGWVWFRRILRSAG